MEKPTKQKNDKKEKSIDTTSSVIFENIVTVICQSTFYLKIH